MASRRFRSITHLHLYAIINTIVKHKYTQQGIKVIRILDVGCGTGVLLSTLIKELPLKNPEISFEFYGLDVNDSHIQESGYFEKMILLLQSVDTKVAWQNNLKLISSHDHWPFEDDFFDIIFSNQVLEHVFDQELFLKEIHRTMKNHGYSFHLYPLKHYIYEGHLLIPFVHKFKSWTTTYYWIKWGIYLGFGTYGRHKKAGLTSSVREFAKRHADYMAFEVNYQTARQIAVTARRCRLKISFDFTYLYYEQKLRSLFGLSPLEIYRPTDMCSSKNSFYFFFLKYVTGITLVLRKNNSF